MNKIKNKKGKKVQKRKEKELIEDEEKEYINTRRKKGKEKNKKHKKIKKIILLIIIICIIIFGVNLGIKTHTWKTLAKDMMSNEFSVVKDTEGNTIATLGSEKKKEKINISEIPNNLKNAYVAIEDQRFYSHKGVDIKRTGGAIISYIFHAGSSSYGGSSITQQLVKNLTGDSTDSIIRKTKEWWKAIQIETVLNKEQILELYLNVIYVGPNIYGVETGSKYYFNKSSKDLTLEECAFLAGINNSPNSYNPFLESDNTEKIKKRTKIVLSKMLELEYIDQTDYNEATSKVENGLKFNKGTINSGDAVYSYHTDALIIEIMEDLKNKYNISESFAKNYIEMAGLNIYSTQNSTIQAKTESEFEKSKYSLPSKTGGNSSQAAMVIIDHKTGNVVACTGGLGKKTESRSLNRATQSIRQTGSAIKPISVLIPAIDKKIITASSIYDDTERDFADGYHPTDYNPSLGRITVRRAVESSQNLPFVEIMEQLKPSKAIQYLEKMGITTLTKDDNNLVLALGGLQDGISPLQMAGAYATIANDGIYLKPIFYKKIEKQNGTILIENKQKSKKVVSKEVAYIVKELLTQPVIGANGTANYCSISNIDVSAKTGTTDDNYDRWLCGFTPYYTAVTWYGYDINESIEYNEKNPAGLIWAKVMSNIHLGLSPVRYNKPSKVTSAIICSKTGLKANSGCPDTYEEYFLNSTVPKNCTEHAGGEIKDNNKSKKNTTVNTQQNIKNTIIDNTNNKTDEVKKENNNINSINNVVKNTNTSNSSKALDNTNSNKNNTNVTQNTSANIEQNTNKNNISNNTQKNNNTTNSNKSNSSITTNNTSIKNNNIAN